MAVLACGRGRFASLACVRVHAVRVGLLCVGMAIGARDPLGRRLVYQALHVFVAIDTRKHPAVDRLLQLFCIDKETDLVSVFIGGQRGIGVAGETIFVFRFLFGASEESAAKQKNERREQDSACNFHGLEETLLPELMR